ncbi:hypothetical protein D9M69_601250 [compost metagenome]
MRPRQRPFGASVSVTRCAVHCMAGEKHGSVPIYVCGCGTRLCAAALGAGAGAAAALALPPPLVSSGTACPSSVVCAPAAACCCWFCGLRASGLSAICTCDGARMTLR